MFPKEPRLMIANSERKTRGGTLARSTSGTTLRTMGRLAAVMVMAAATGIIVDATPAPVRLVGVSAQGDSLLIEATEPVAYSVSRPDPLKLVVDMRNVSVSDARNDVTRQGAIAGVRFEQATASDGKSVGRVHVDLARPAEHAVRSMRNTIRVELTARNAAVIPPAQAATPRQPPTPQTTAPAAAPAKPTAQTAPTAPAKTAETTPAKTAAPAAAKPSATTATTLDRVQSKKSPATTTITLSGNGRLAPSNVVESKDRPRRLVIDFPNVASKAPTQTAIDSALVSRVRVGLNSSQPLVTRVVMEIANDTRYRVERSGENGRDLDIVFEGKIDALPALPTEPVTEPVEPEAPITLQQAIENAAAITPKDPIAAAPKPVTPAQPTKQPQPVPQQAQPPQPIDAMAALRSSLITAPAPAATAAAPAVPVPSAPAPSAPARPSAPPQTVPAAQPTTTAAAPTPSTSPTAGPSPTPVAARTQTPAASTAQAPGATVLRQTPQSAQPGQRAEQPQQKTRQFTGHTVSLDFEGVDLRAVLRTFSDVSGLNMVIDPDVNGTVDIKLTDVPWDQALDVVLKGQGLDYTVDGTIVRISRLQTLENESKARVAAAQAAAEHAAQAGGLAFETFPLSYAKAADTAPLLRGSLRLSRYGQVQVDARTNTLIIADLPEQFPVIRQLLQTLDRAEPQVEIEARIITTTREFARAIGVQWGLNGRMTPEIGNTTNLAFPNQGTLGGRVGGTQGAVDVRGDPLQNAATGVDLGVNAASSAIGLALGSINGAFNLDVALSALERTGKGRILSTPRVTTQNNVEAEITQGTQIPVQTEANNTITVTFKDAALTLKVTPQITSANTVIMQITVENASPGTEYNGIPSIDTQRAITRVQVSDGTTTVLGGIFVQREANTIDRTPVLHRIPLLGWLFKRDVQADESDELLIFITPRILKG